MVELSVEEIIHIHDIVVEQFKISRGVINQGILEAIVKRPELKIGSDEYVYEDVFSKAATILEGIIRWHPFVDGNKRTALLTTIFYLKLQGYGVAVPLSAVRYTVNIAKNEKIDDKSVQKLIKEIALWLKNHSGHNANELSAKIAVHLTLPYKFLVFLIKIGFKKYVERKVSYWMAFDIYPEYEKEAMDMISFINDTLQASMRVFEE